MKERNDKKLRNRVNVSRKTFKRRELRRREFIDLWSAMPRRGLLAWESGSPARQIFSYRMLICFYLFSLCIEKIFSLSSIPKILSSVVVSTSILFFSLHDGGFQLDKNRWFQRILMVSQQRKFSLGDSIVCLSRAVSVRSSRPTSYFHFYSFFYSWER